MEINKSLEEYCEKNIIPLYEKLDKAHQVDHVHSVISKSLKIAQNYDVNRNMVYTIAVFHDIGNLDGRKMHHITGGRRLVEDIFVNDFFNSRELVTMKQAIEDHRASLKQPPRTIYGKIIAEADRFESVDDVVRRCYLFNHSKYPDLTYDERVSYVFNHLEEKYGESGYLKLWLDTTDNVQILKELRALIKNDKLLNKKILEIHKTVEGVK